MEKQKLESQLMILNSEGTQQQLIQAQQNTKTLLAEITQLVPTFSPEASQPLYFDHFYHSLQQQVQENLNIYKFGENMNQAEIKKMQDTIQELEYTRVENQKIIEELEK